MQLFLDTAILSEIKEGLEIGSFKGITTNPSLIAKTNAKSYIMAIKLLTDYLQKFENLISISIEVYETKVEKILKQADEFRKLLKYDNLYIKVPIGWTELKAINYLKKEGFKINCTCIFTLNQCILASETGADYVSLFYCRLKDAGGNPDKIINDYNKWKIKNNCLSKLIAGSIRTPLDVEAVAIAGADICTTSLDTYKNCSKHFLTDQSVEGFLKDFKSWK